MVPVMLMGTLIGGIHYSSLEYACALLLAAGISLFAHSAAPVVERKLANPNAPLGYALCLVNLVFDGYTNAAQVSHAHMHGGVWSYHSFIVEAAAGVGQAVLRQTVSCPALRLESGQS